ncbi:sugar transporter ERD6-like 6 [Zerene cesonia]|uniref:sugar transporter ERD6-like 6 n=1 Tax=Zerene cesonia TaxID=33412 RepID=UPI0018E4ED25|nr:sugar transporter ERD6-like 6 [Zerene cesonia]
MARLTTKQALVVTGLMFINISDGYIYGQMSGMIDALRAPNSAIPVTDEDISWIDQYIGRRKSVMLFSSPILATWIILYYAQSKTVLLISRVIVGVFFGSVITVSYINIGEYISSKNRSFYTNLVCGAGPIIGTMIGHVLSILLHWRHVALIGIIPTSLSIILPMFWVESPSWLASKGRFDECRVAFKALRGFSEEACNELDQLISHEKSKQRSYSVEKRNTMLAKLITAFKTKSFWKVMGLSIVIGDNGAAGS